MNSNNNIAISFAIRKNRMDENGYCHVYMRVTVGGERIELGTNRKVRAEKWSNGMPVGNANDERSLRTYLQSLQNKIYDIHRYLIDRNMHVSVDVVKNMYLGNTSSSKTVLTVFAEHNEEVKQLIGKDYAKLTYTRYLTTYKHVEAFIKKKYKKKDVSLAELNYAFVTGFEKYLKIDRECNHNSAIKYIKNFKKVVNYAIKLDYLQNDPFKNFSVKLKPVERPFLTSEELDKLENVELDMPQMDFTRDVFLFACYTGLAYVEVQSLTKDHVEVDENGMEWIKIKRMKTHTKSIIPILPKAKALIEKYEGQSPSGQLLPIMSNQKTNLYLKLVARDAGITKLLTYHIARHTFATTVTLTNGISIESVSAMLGHKSIRTTQIYSKVVEEKVGAEMKKLMGKF